MKKKYISILLIVVITLIISAVIIAVYIKFFGKTTLESIISGIIGYDIGFEEIDYDGKRGVVTFEKFTISGRQAFGKDMFRADKCVFTLGREDGDKGRVIIKEMQVEKGLLNIIRNKAGLFNVACLDRPSTDYGSSVAYASPIEGATPFYDFASKVEKITVRNSFLLFEDDFVPKGPFAITFKDLNVNFASRRRPDVPDSISAECGVSFSIPNPQYRDGRVVCSASMAVYPYMTDMNAVLNTSNVDLMQFLPYFESYTPFSFRKGLFSSHTKFEIHNHEISSPTTMVFHELKLLVGPGMENAQFFATSANKLLPYLTSGSGEIVFDFIINGPLQSPQANLGPRVRQAMGMAAMEGLGRILQQFK